MQPDQDAINRWRGVTPFGWSGPRLGINWAGYVAWLVGFLVGVPEHIPGPPAFFVGAILYCVVAKAGLRPPVAGAGTDTTQPRTSRLIQGFATNSVGATIS